MLTGNGVWSIVLLGWFTECTWGSWVALPAWTSIDCETPKQIHFAITQKYIGVIEVVNISQGAEIFLESASCPDCLSFLELSCTDGDKVASVITKKPLDAEALKEPSGPLSSLSYSITCNNTGVRNNRTLVLKDLHDIAPVFEKDEYTVNVSKVVHVADVNEPPVFSSKEYRAEILNEVADGYPVLQVKATDPNVGDTLLYSLVKSSSMFGVEPSSGQVYVLSVTGESGKVTLQVKAEDQGGLYDTTTVEVIITDSSSNSVTISLNQPFDSVIYLILPIEEVLEKALGLDVKLINVTGNNAEVLIRLIAKETSGSVVPAEDLKNELMNKKEIVQSKLAAVFDYKVNFDIITKHSNTNMIFIVGTLVPVALLSIAAVLVGFWRKKGHEGQRRESNFSLDDRAYLME